MTVQSVGGDGSHHRADGDLQGSFQVGADYNVIARFPK
jgi:hypothetical protein